MINRLADSRGLGSFHCVLGLPRRRTYTELDSGGQPNLQSQTLARYAAVLFCTTCVRRHQHSRWYEAPPDRDRLTCCIYPQLFRHHRPPGVLGATR